jgi:hypothetical protein
MREQDDEKFSESLAILSETYKPFTDAKEMIWAALFENYEIEDFQAAVIKHITDPVRGSYPDVKPADILRFMPEPKQSLQIEDKGGLSWCDNTQNLIDKYCPDEYKLKVGK